MERVWSFWWIPLQQKLVGGFSPSIWKIWSSKWVHLPQFFGVRIPKHIWVATTPTSFRNWDFPWILNMFIVRFLIIVKEFHHFFSRRHADSSKTTSRDCRMFPIQRVYRLSIVQSGHPSQRNRLGPCNACRYLKRNVVGPKGGSVLFVWSKQSLNGFLVFQDTRIKRLNGLNRP